MVKLTLVGRISDGLPLAQTPSYLLEDNDEHIVSYKEQAQLLLKQVSRGILKDPKMLLIIDHHYFHYLLGNGVCYITLCELSYPTKLAFYYLQDLQKELEKAHTQFIESFTDPYSFKRFDYVIGNIRRRYMDTRTQANLSIINDRKHNFDVVTEEFFKVISKCTSPGSELKICGSSFDGESKLLMNSEYLEVIALKWTPITVCMLVAALLLWTRIVLNDNDNITAW